MRTKRFDVIILGSGPAGLQAAIHAARRKVSVLVLGKLRKSSAYQVHIENFCCISGKAGSDMLEQARRRAESVGVEFLEQDVTDLKSEGGHFLLEAEGGKTFEAGALIFAMGISRNKLGLKGEKEYLGKGVAYCVDCDAAFFRDQAVALVGCESAAVTGALTLLFYAREVHLICERLDVNDFLAQRLEESPIIVHEGRRVGEIRGEDTVKGLILDDGTELQVEGVFIELGAKGVTELAGRLGVALDQETMRYISTNKKQETNIPGIYAAGDICGPPWQVAKSVGEGCIAGLEAAAHAKKQAKKST
ncbi:MAG: NAD(P)/FAD-dependent oxidoreductase [Desulfatiglandales bacterium]